MVWARSFGSTDAYHGTSRLLRETFSLVPDYLRTEADRGFGGLPWYSEYEIQQTRGFRALKLWMTLQHLGRDGVRDLVARHVTLAQRLAGLVDAAPDLERLGEVELSIVCFRCVPPRLRGNDRALDALNKRVMEEVHPEEQRFGKKSEEASVAHDQINIVAELLAETSESLTGGILRLAPRTSDGHQMAEPPRRCAA